MNTLGSGKMKLLLEGLCENCGDWGFYFTSTVDSSFLGSSDIQDSIKTQLNLLPNIPGSLNHIQFFCQNHEWLCR